MNVSFRRGWCTVTSFVVALTFVTVCHGQRSLRFSPPQLGTPTGEPVIIIDSDSAAVSPSPRIVRAPRSTVASRTFVPRHQRMSGALFGDGEVISVSEPTISGETVYEDVSKSVHPGHPVHGGCGGNCGGCGQGGGCGGCGGGCGSACGGGGGCMLPCPKFTLKNTYIWAGVHGAMNPRTVGAFGSEQRSSFGFQEGINWGSFLPCSQRRAFAIQLGVQAVQSNFAGAPSTPESRSQIFLTGGLFRRVDCGLQGGVVVDYLREDWFTEMSLVQVRGEASWVYPAGCQLGVMFAGAAQSDTNPGVLGGQTADETWEPIDHYAAFLGKEFACGGEGRLFFGLTGESDGLLGGRAQLPISSHWALQSGFTYLISQDTASTSGAADEVWNVAINLVWYPGGFEPSMSKYNRPLLPVADNGSFLMSRVRN